MDEAALDALLESLSADTAFTDQLKDFADTCIAALNTSLTPQQQGVFVLACIHLSQKTECARQDVNATLCLNAMTLMKCPIGIQSFVDAAALRSCWRQQLVSVVSSLGGGSFSDESFVDEACPVLEENARALANCSLQAAGLASGDTVDLAAVGTAIDASTVTSDSEKALQQAVLATCQANSATTVDAFLDCWATEAADGCVTSGAERIATGGRRGRGPPGGVIPFGGRGGRGGPRGRGGRGGGGRGGGGRR